MTSPSTQLLTEVFPVKQDTLPKLSAYELDVKGSNISSVGGKLAYRLRKKFRGHWVWTEWRLATDNRRSEEEIMKVVQELWGQHRETFKDLRKVVFDPAWEPSSQAIADFVARGLFDDVRPDVERVLEKERRDLGKVIVERVHESRGWVVEGRPAVSVSVFSRLTSKQDLQSHWVNLPSSESLKGLWVYSKTSSLKGRIIGVEGVLREHRERLLALTDDEKLQEILEKAPYDEPVVRVESGQNQYDYTASALRVIVRMEDLQRFNVSRNQVSKILRIEPSMRNNLVRLISSFVVNKNQISEPYNSMTSPGLFFTAEDVKFRPALRFGGSNVAVYDEKGVLANLRRFGLYKALPRFENGTPIKIGIINALTVPVDGFLSPLRSDLASLNFPVDYVREVRIEEVDRVHIEKAVSELEDTKPNLVLALLPDQFEEDEEGWGTYHELKSLTISKDIPSQVVYKSTLDKKYAIANVILGILGKIGNIPYALAEPLPYADLVVGIDVAREKKRRLAGSLNATAIARIYFGNGELLRYVIHDAPLEGEAIPENVIQRLFPMNDFKGKRAIIHRDGIFRRDEKEALKSWAEKIGAQFFLVEIIKTGTPRLYGKNPYKIVRPPKGSIFKLSDTEAFLVSSLPPFEDATPQPLRVRTEPPFTIEQAIHSILSLTLIHYGSLRSPRLPVTIHYSDKIAYLALRGIKPKNLEGTLPFWL